MLRREKMSFDLKISNNNIGVSIVVDDNTIQSITIASTPIGDNFDSATSGIYQQFRNYLDATPHQFVGSETYRKQNKLVRDGINLNLSLLTDFQKIVFSELSKIPYGKTISYQELASRVKDKNYARAVAMALSKNPFPIAIPCHRVVGKNSIGGFSGGGGVETKKILLEMEYNCVALL